MQVYVSRDIFHWQAIADYSGACRRGVPPRQLGMDTHRALIGDDCGLGTGDVLTVLHVSYLVTGNVIAVLAVLHVSYLAHYSHSSRRRADGRRPGRARAAAHRLCSYWHARNATGCLQGGAPGQGGWPREGEWGEGYSRAAAGRKGCRK